MMVPLDSGRNFIDQNGHRMKKFTLLPLIKAVEDLSEQGVTQKFDWTSVDFVTDRGRLRKLLAWATGISDEWRIDTQLAGTNTVLLSGRAPVTKETSGQSTSYGFNFEDASTYPAPGLRNEPSHHRIIAYVRALVHVLTGLTFNVTRTSMGLEWLSASKSMPASLTTPPPRYPHPTTPPLVGGSRRKRSLRVHPRTPRK